MESHEGIISIHTAVTALSVAVGRLEEQLKAVREDLKHHTQNEHKAFEDALEVVSEIKEDVSRLQALVDSSKGAWWLLAKLGAVLVGIVTILGAVVQYFHK